MVLCAIVCDNLRSAYNVGSIIRNADGLGYDVITTGFSPPATHPKVQKTALGASNVATHHIDSVPACIDYIQKKYTNIYVMETTSSAIDLPDVTTHTGPFALVVGNEITGVSYGMRQAARQIYRIPMIGSKGSYNVANTASMAMYHFFLVQTRTYL